MRANGRPADLGRQDPRHRAEACVAGLMAVLIVELLEVIDVHLQQRERRAVALGPRPFLGRSSKWRRFAMPVKPSEVPSAASLSCRSLCSVMSREIATTPPGKCRHRIESQYR
jgi:hypothetical protein